jgi:hypothetical protein
MYGNENSLDWRWYWNGMWCIIVTMSTVGFGDFYPISLMGRAISVIAAFWGNFLISLMINALTVWVEFNPQEAASYDTVKSINSEIEYGLIGVMFLQNMRRYTVFCRQNKDKHAQELNSAQFLQEKSIRFTKLRFIIERFRETRKAKNLKIESMLIEIALSQLDSNINTELDKIKYQTLIFPEIRELLKTYSKNQEYIQKLTIELYKDLEEMDIFINKHMKRL